MTSVFFWMRLYFTGVVIPVSLFSHAQLCTGSLGDPVVNITFGAATVPDTHFMPPAAYTYTNSSCPNDGYYTITTSTSGCFGNTWHTVNADHTGNGAFMLVNASYEPADFFVTTVTGLCPNTTYEFSAWIMNVLVSPAGIQPNLTFRIETTNGVVINTFNTGNIAVSSQPEWKQYGFYFTTTADNSGVVLRIINNAPGGIGNDLAMDDITFRPCGPVITAAILSNNNSVDECINEQKVYDFTAVVSPGFISPVFQWQESTDSGGRWKDIAGADFLTYQRRPVAASGRYWYRLTVAESGSASILSCRIASNVLMVNVHPKPVVNAGPDRIALLGEQTTLNATASGENISFTWSPPDYLSSITLINPVVTPERDMYYLLSAVSEFGCTKEDDVFIKVVAGIFVPTAFTPNNDGKNDRWRIPFLDPAWGAAVSVFNRYGQLVYHVAGASVNWDGNLNGMPQPAGTYVYMIHFTNGRPDRKGALSLIR